MTTYSQSVSAGSTETITLGNKLGIQSASYNNVNELVGLSAGGPAVFSGASSKPMKSMTSMTLSTQVLTVNSTLQGSATGFSAASSRVPKETVSFAYAPGQWTGDEGYMLTVGGTPTPGDVVSINFWDVRLPQNVTTISVPVVNGDTTTSIATNISGAISQNADLSAIRTFVWAQNNATLYICTNNYPVPISGSMAMTGPNSSPGSETVTLAQASDENTLATIGGTATTGDVVSVTVSNPNLANGSETASYTVVGGDTTTSIATGLKNAVNADTKLQAIGVSATSSGTVVNLNAFTTYSTSVTGSATETLTSACANRGSANITVGGKPTTGDVLTITAKNGALSGGQKNISYTVLSTDNLQTIAQALTTAFNADTSLQAIGCSISNPVTLPDTMSFTGSAGVPTGTSGTATIAVDGSNNTRTNSYQQSVNSGSSTSLTFDANGNMTSDGTNSYAWDAENRLIKITYPGSGNYSQFSHDPFWRNVKIVETMSGSITSTKQLVWAMDTKRLHQPCEERDASGALTKVFLENGQLTGSSKYFFLKDLLLSTRQMCDSSGNLQADYQYAPFGQVSKFRETASADFQYAGYYSHQRSGLNVATYRLYNPSAGRWLSRDPLIQQEGLNLYAYANNDPVSFVDPPGLQAQAVLQNPALQQAIDEAIIIGTGALVASASILGGILDYPRRVAKVVCKALARNKWEKCRDDVNKGWCPADPDNPSEDDDKRDLIRKQMLENCDRQYGDDLQNCDKL